MKRQIIHLKMPCDEADVQALGLGDVVSLSGRIATGRDRFHKYLHEGNASPVDLSGRALFHCGPVVVAEEGRWKVTAAGPTTSIREEPYMAGIIAANRVRAVIGKGGMGPATAKACADCGCVYLQAVGGAAAVLASAIKNVVDVYLLEAFGPTEAVWDLDVEGVEAIVAIDARGNSIYKEIGSRSRSALDNLV